MHVVKEDSQQTTSLAEIQAAMARLVDERVTLRGQLQSRPIDMAEASRTTALIIADSIEFYMLGWNAKDIQPVAKGYAAMLDALTLGGHGGKAGGVTWQDLIKQAEAADADRRAEAEDESESPPFAQPALVAVAEAVAEEPPGE